MTKTNSIELRSDVRAPIAMTSDREEVATLLQDALTTHRFGEPERSLIVQIVCDALFNGHVETGR